VSGIEIEGKEIHISNPEKLLWPKAGIRKADYIKALIELSPFLLPYIADKELTAIRYPDGIGGKSFYQKRPPRGAPEWIDVITSGEDTFINLNSLPALLWLGNLAVIEFHAPFSKSANGMLDALVFDLDPSEGQTFADAAECAIKVHETLEDLGIEDLVKTSGASGLQIYIPVEKMTFEQGRAVNTFFGKYFTERFPALMTIERQVNKRGRKLYFDYLQMWNGKNIISVYSPRAVECAAVSMPVTWDELKIGISPCDFNLNNASERLKQKGDLFSKLLNENSNSPAIEEIIRKQRLDRLTRM
jgi:bifunctional non-homologous end joining protein LigD